jgi:hypothetical protein
LPLPTRQEGYPETQRSWSFESSSEAPRQVGQTGRNQVKPQELSRKPEQPDKAMSWRVYDISTANSPGFSASVEMWQVSADSNRARLTLSS